MVKQWVENKAAKDSDWLIGEGCFMPDKKGIALRNMKNPGTAYKNEKGVSCISICWSITLLIRFCSLVAKILNQQM